MLSFPKRYHHPHPSPVIPTIGGNWPYFRHRYPLLPEQFPPNVGMTGLGCDATHSFRDDSTWVRKVTCFFRNPNTQGAKPLTLFGLYPSKLQYFACIQFLPCPVPNHHPIIPGRQASKIKHYRFWSPGHCCGTKHPPRRIRKCYPITFRRF